MKKSFLFLAAVCATGLAVLPVAASASGGNAEKGKARAAQVCGACHGPEGNKPTPGTPILAGQYEDYLVRALTDYKAGRRQNPIMRGFASTLSEGDMNDVAAWFSSQSSPLHTVR